MWPQNVKDLPFSLRRWHIFGRFLNKKNELYYSDLIVIPKTVKMEIVKRITDGHMGIARCLQRARKSVF